MRERPDGKRSANGKTYDPERLFLPPDDDLAPNRPGETLRARLDGSAAAGASGRARLLIARLLGRRPVEDVWRRALAAEQCVGAALEGIAGSGWDVVHSIVLPGDAIISHLLIGPGGVFGISTRPGRRARVRAGESQVRTDRERRPCPYVRETRHDAARASLVLSRGCGFLVQVQPVLVFAGARSVEAAPELGDVRVMGEGEVPGLGALGGVLHPDRARRIHTVARNRRVWLWA